jgi:predicted ester cyclase
MDPAAQMRKAYELINAHDIEAFGDMLSDDFVEHEALEGFAPTKEGVKEFFTANIAAFSDLRFEPEDVFAGGDKAVGRFRMVGTHDGDFMAMSATGKRVDVAGIDIIRFDESGVAVEHWGAFDTMAMMQQLGLAPDGPAA